MNTPPISAPASLDSVGVRFRSILVLVEGRDDERSVLQSAVMLALSHHAKLTLFDAVEIETFHLDEGEDRAALDAFNQANLDHRYEELDGLRRHLVSEHPGLDVAIDLRTGDVSRKAVRSVLVSQHDLVMKAAEGDSGRLKVLFGNTGQKLMRKCPCPVLIVKPSAGQEFKKILAAVDLDPSEREAEQLARKILSLATALATEAGGELHVVHAWRLAGATKLKRSSIDITDLDHVAEMIEAAHRSELARLVTQSAHERQTVHLVKGRASEVIHSLTEELDVDLLVIGTVGRTGVPGLFIGNTAEKVLNAVQCSVLGLKPDGFETPIEV